MMRSIMSVVAVAGLKIEIRGKMKKIFALMFLTLALSYTVKAQTKEDREAVRQAALDYIEAVYDVDPAKVERSVHPDLAKRGFFIKKGEAIYTQHTMTFAQLVELAKSYNKNGRVAKDAPKEVIIFEVSDQTASAKVIATWGIDYLHLAKYDGKWKIINILWQSPPKQAK
ncbi:MAG: nuclear transport factor 2 family protein [Acidobacteria bacterium]|nr:nuclear transport factor 2 family protein [Acidobacteriota bacterium]